ncbi:MAG TPA: ThiF family adenylyltransferase [Candidatus Saccharimonadales bacterium]|nr:ThiF family adenylyltransferase [Candidatus Saccharimonadales bacterium]
MGKASKASYADQTDIFDPARFTWPVHVIGLGGIGSSLVLPLVKLGLRTELHLWDDDELIEPHNIPAQLVYRRSDIGKAKAPTMVEILEPYCEPQCQLVPHAEKVTSETPLSGIVISGVDSMASRQAIWEAIKLNFEVPLYIDGRIGGEQIQLFTVDPSDLDASELYEEGWLFPDEDGAELPCAARTVIGPPVVLAGMIITQLTRFARNLPTQRYVDMHVRESQLIAF